MTDNVIQLVDAGHTPRRKPARKAMRTLAQLRVQDKRNRALNAYLEKLEFEVVTI